MVATERWFVGSSCIHGRVSLVTVAPALSVRMAEPCRDCVRHGLCLSGYAFRSCGVQTLLTRFCPVDDISAAFLLVFDGFITYYKGIGSA